MGVYDDFKLLTCIRIKDSVDQSLSLLSLFCFGGLGSRRGIGHIRGGPGRTRPRPGGAASPFPPLGIGRVLVSFGLLSLSLFLLATVVFVIFILVLVLLVLLLLLVRVFG